MKVREVMISDLICCHPLETVQAAARLMATNDIGSLPVISNGEAKLVGIVTDRDLACRVLATGHDGETKIETAMTRDPISCEPDASLDRCEELMKKHQVRRIPVVDQQGCCVGIVAQADIARIEKPQKVKETIAGISEPNPEPSRRAG